MPWLHTREYRRYFDDVRFRSAQNGTMYEIDSSEAAWNMGRTEAPNLGHKVGYKWGYFPVSPSDTLQDIRSEMVNEMRRIGIVVEAHHQTRGAHMAEVLALFEADTVDPARVAALRAQAEAERRQVADAITQSVTEVHDVLTPVQRKAVADWIRAQASRHGG